MNAAESINEARRMLIECHSRKLLPRVAEASGLSYVYLWRLASGEYDNPKVLTLERAVSAARDVLSGQAEPSS